jgi:hypothetical protein
LDASLANPITIFVAEQGIKKAVDCDKVTAFFVNCREGDERITHLSELRSLLLNHHVHEN